MRIPDDKPYIVLKGSGKKKTIVVWDDHETIAQSPTFTLLADNIVVKCLSFRVNAKSLFLLVYAYFFTLSSFLLCYS